MALDGMFFVTPHFWGLANVQQQPGKASAPMSLSKVAVYQRDPDPPACGTREIRRMEGAGTGAFVGEAAAGAHHAAAPVVAHNATAAAGPFLWASSPPPAAASPLPPALIVEAGEVLVPGAAAAALLAAEAALAAAEAAAGVSSDVPARLRHCLPVALGAGSSPSASSPLAADASSGAAVGGGSLRAAVGRLEHLVARYVTRRQGKERLVAELQGLNGALEGLLHIDERFGSAGPRPPPTVAGGASAVVAGLDAVLEADAALGPLLARAEAVADVARRVKSRGAAPQSAQAAAAAVAGAAAQKAALDELEAAVTALEGDAEQGWRRALAELDELETILAQ